MPTIRGKRLLEIVADEFNKILPSYYQIAPQDGELSSYCVISNANFSTIADSSAGDLIFFAADIYANEMLENASEELEELCEQLRNTFDGATIYKANELGGHLGFESQYPVQESDTDINHRRQEWAARVFYN